MPARLSEVEASASYLLARLALIEGRVRAVVARRRQDDPAPDDPFRGLYISDEQVDLMLSNGTASRLIDWDDDGAIQELDAEAARLEESGEQIRLRTLARRAGLDVLDIDLLLIALAPDLDVRFERLYGYLNDDVSRRRATIALAIELAGSTPWSADARLRLSPDGPLVTNGLVLVEEPDRPYLSRSLRVPDRVAAHLLGGDRPDPGVAHLLVDSEGRTAGPLTESLASVMAGGVDLVYLREKAGASAVALAAEALETSGRPPVVIDLARLDPTDDPADVTRIARREALLSGGGVIAGPIDDLVERTGAAVRALAAAALEGSAGVPLVLHGRVGWEPGWSRTIPVFAEVDADPSAGRLAFWMERLGDDAPADLAASDVAGQFLLSSDQVHRAVDAARLQARLEGEDIDYRHLRFGARAQNGAGLERLSRRIQPHVGWDDLVLAPTTAASLHELAARARRRTRVLDEWGMRPGGGRGRGITVLFAGDSGTGKTMSAEVVAGDLGLDLYTVNLATVVDKYVGETEKNLERIFTEADGVNAVLLFDEADAIFGKRSEVKDANDRYANIEVAYLLQRMETFDGIAILATNLRANVDDAFARRLDLIIDFPTPDVELRRALWDRCLSVGVPRSDDIDLDFCAKAFELSGGNIRSIAITAAYTAAESGHPVSMLDLVRATQQEYRKLGRLVVAGEFGSYYPLLSS
ncbi:MAG TPA: ATP-binding protein [Acidimicrobiales bacterium]|nr:ATP-binding protein [Acidimicrobiales bacterium]